MNEQQWWKHPDSKVDQELWPLYDDFRKFLFVVWKHKGLPEPTELQYDVANFLQSDEKRIVIEAFRGFGKSFITSAFVCWQLMRSPQKKILIVSATKERADGFSLFIKALINELPFLQHLKALTHQRNSNIAFDVAPALPDPNPSVRSAGITGTITGSRADLIIGDDIEVPNNSDTALAREKLSEQVKEFDSILTTKDDARIVFLGTPQSEESIYTQLQERGFAVRIWPVQFPKQEDIYTYKGEVAPMLLKKLAAGTNTTGEPTEPTRFHYQLLEERKLSIGASTFALQFMLQTTLSDQEKYPLKLKDLIVHDLDNDVAPINIAWSNSATKRDEQLPATGFNADYFYRAGFVSDDYNKYTDSVLVIDSSGRGADETAYCVLKFLAGRIYLLKVGGFQGGYEPETLLKLAEVAKEYSVYQVLVESNFGDGMWSTLFQPILSSLHPCKIEEIRHNTQKERRIIDTLEPVMNSHKLVVSASCVQEDYANIPKTNKGHQNRLFYQLTHITKDKGSLNHDDRLDCLAMGVAWFTSQLSVDSEKAAEAIREKQLDEVVARFLRKAGRTQQQTWADSW